MPRRSPKQCKHPGCNVLTFNIPPLCDKHLSDIKQSQKQYDIRRGTPTERGYDYEWQKLRAKKLKADPYCECTRCKSAGRVRVADLVHHIKPIEDYPELRLAWKNLQSMYHECHEIEHGRKKVKDNIYGN